MFKVNDHWMTSGEQEQAIIALLLPGAGLIKWDNAHMLPLKSGGKTDIYVNMRNMRSSPKALAFLASAYSDPLRRLGVDRFVEVPEAVSPLAGAISVATDIPLVTVREEEKPGRVTKGVLIGDLNPGERVAIVDDVITDGASKIAALKALRIAGANIRALVVLVDRQQGWKQKLVEAGFGDVPVWSAMTLHDIRRFLIQKGLMQRCDKAVEEKNPLILALDGKSWEEVLPLIDQLRTTGCILKVNDMLFSDGLERLLPNLSVYGRVMADLKCHDIPNTVANTCKRMLHCPPWAVTVHASGAGDMVKAAKEALKNTSTKVLAVTVLTSLDAQTCDEVYHTQPLDQVMRLASIAANAGADGFVCSALEVRQLANAYPGKIFVVPGTRSPGADANDQARVDTPRNAIANGATHLVGGRQFLGAKDPVAEVKRVLKEELNIQL